LDERIARAHRKAWIRTLVLSLATVLVALGFLFFTYWQVREAQGARQLEAVRTEKAIQARSDAEAKLKAAQEALSAATEQTNKLQQQIGELQTQLAQALDLEKHIYKLDWAELKMMASENGPATDLLMKIESLKSKVHWGMANTAAGGYNSPGFAALVLGGRLPNGNLASLPQEAGPPYPGDVILYPGGYRLFYFRDHQRNEFVVGMTPFGVVALNYDFARPIAVLRTGISRR
jgi:hypothetical protein